MAKPKETFQAELIYIDEMTPTVRNFHFQFREKPRFDYEPGQFVMVEIPREGKIVRKPYSIASPPQWPDKIELCIKQVEGGYVSTYFFNLKVGYIMPMQGPLGIFRLKEPYPQHFLFVATGTGVAPLRAQIHHLLHHGHKGPITLILGIRHEYEILFDQEFKELKQKYPNFEYIPTISRPKHWDGAVGYVQEQIKARYPNPEGIQIYACGLVPMINALLKELGEIGYPREVIHFEKWT